MGSWKLKAARLKLDALAHAEKLIGKKPFDDLSVVVLVEKLNITKVTFYKYFRRKQDILHYYFRVWCLRQTVELLKSPKEGLEGISFLSDKLSELYHIHPGIVRGWIYYSGSLSKKQASFVINKEEKKLLFPTIQGIEKMYAPSFEEMITEFISQAIHRKEIPKGQVQDLTNRVIVVIYGSLMVAHVQPSAQVKDFCKRAWLTMLG
ncbi:MAG: TetR/AcrR family transcriptional regulator [Bacteroidetes bacterium]|nr:TetR/AcrR family transcriptional regulator [Bacteroidota bacterium]